MKKTLDQWLVFFVPISVSNFHFQFLFHFHFLFFHMPLENYKQELCHPFYCIVTKIILCIVITFTTNHNGDCAHKKLHVSWIHCFSLLSRSRCGLANNCNYEVIPVWIMYNTAFVIDTLGWGTVNKQKLLNSVDISLIFSFHPKPMGMHVGHLLGGQRSQI